MTDEQRTVVVCGKCGARLQVPVGKGNLMVTCPVCKSQFPYYDVNVRSSGIDYSSLGLEKQEEKPQKSNHLKYVLAAALLCLAFYCGMNYSKMGRLFPCSHIWTEATCTSPKTCSKCGETEGVPLGHSWQEADCTTARHCTQCGKTSGSPLGHDWLEETDTAPQMCKRCGEMVPKELPENGEVFIGENLYRYSGLTILSSSAQSYYIKMKDRDGVDVFSFFVRAGETVTIDVPGGYYQVFFACGNDWYGTEYLFGNETAYSKDDEILDFSNYTWQYTLYPVTNGNFQETEISADEF